MHRERANSHLICVDQRLCQLSLGELQPRVQTWLNFRDVDPIVPNRRHSPADTRGIWRS